MAAGQDGPVSGVLVTGAGGFIGGHLVGALLERGHEVRAADIQPLPEWKQVHSAADNTLHRCDLALLANCRLAVEGCHTVYHLAADTGGMGYLAAHRADCMLNVLSDTHMLIAARDAHVGRFYFASTSCVYPNYRQTVTNPPPLAEDGVWPADPEAGYGLSKLHTEQMCRYFAEDYGLPVRIGRNQSIYGPLGWYTGGREKVPTAVCRKIAVAKLSGTHEIGVWGDGQATRNFIYISDAVDAILAIAACDYDGPLNVGSPEATSIDQLISLTEEIAGWKVARRQVPGPEGVRGRSSDMTLVAQHAGWKPQVSLYEGMKRTYAWVYDQLKAAR
jgi:nucleoside-diphosphate-sugar epimerase